MIPDSTCKLIVLLVVQSHSSFILTYYLVLARDIIARSYLSHISDQKNQHASLSNFFLIETCRR